MMTLSSRLGLPLIVLVLLVASSGCTQVEIDGDRTIYSYAGWFVCLWIGLGCLGCAAIVAAVWRLRSPRSRALLLLIPCVVWLMLLAAEKVEVDSEQFYVRRWGLGLTASTVRFDALKEIRTVSITGMAGRSPATRHYVKYVDRSRNEGEAEIPFRFWPDVGRDILARAAKKGVLTP